MAHYIARRYANMLREEDLVNHIVYFRTQNLGKYLGKKVKQYDFDTARLRPIYAAILAARGIREPFRFYLRKMDSTMNRSNFPDSLQQQFPVITKSFPTYKFESEEKYVRALFGPPTGYLLRQLGWVLGGSVILLIIVGCTLYYLIAIIRREKKLSAIKNDFISNITHELKTPVATISAAMEALERFDVQANKEKTGRYLFISKSELRRLSDMINHILQTSLYEKGQVAINAVTVNLDKMVQTLIANYSLHDKKEVSIVYSNETNSENIIADHLHLYNMLNNLVDNAIKYSGERVDIGIRYYRQDGFNIVSIKDNGIGIANKELPFIFEKFYRVPTGNLHRVKGYGLGLNYVKNIMEKHGGWYKAESQPGFGSTFYIGFAL